METWYSIGLFFILLTIGYVVGRWNEKRHFLSIIQREKQLSSLLTFSERVIPAQFTPCRGQLVTGSVVISVDYFKMISAALRKLIGGRVQAFESLLERGRREAILRMKQQASDLGATAVFNVRLQTASISQGQNNQVGSVEMYAYGTAIVANTPAANE
jgi:uncharacterized protein YbjQ (UPF0145 family)